MEDWTDTAVPTLAQRRTRLLRLAMAILVIIALAGVGYVLFAPSAPCSCKPLPPPAAAWLVQLGLFS